MKTAKTLTTLICLFQSPVHADGAIADLVSAGVPADAVGLMGESDAIINPVARETWKLPHRDSQILIEGVNRGGVVVTVIASDWMVGIVEAIFTQHGSEYRFVKTSARPRSNPSVHSVDKT